MAKNLYHPWCAKACGATIYADTGLPVCHESLDHIPADLKYQITFVAKCCPVQSQHQQYGDLIAHPKQKIDKARGTTIYNPL